MPLNMRFRFSPTKDGLVKVLGPLETEIMQIIWQDERSTVKKVHRKLSQHRDIAYTTVMTTMSRLVRRLRADLPPFQHTAIQASGHARPQYVIDCPESSTVV